MRVLSIAGVGICLLNATCLADGSVAPPTAPRAVLPQEEVAPQPLVVENSAKDKLIAYLNSTDIPDQQILLSKILKPEVTLAQGVQMLPQKNQIEFQAKVK
jgi:hypothetical protein